MIKDLEGVPKEIERADKSFSEPAMCDIILNLIPGSFKDMYYSRKMSHFPVKVDKLQTKLALIEPKYKEKKDLQHAVHKKTPANSAKDKHQANGNKNTQGTKCTLDNPIPRKKLGESANKKQRKLCQLCAKHSPKVKNTHNTSECRKWNPDGSLQNGEKHARAQTLVPKPLMKCFAQMRKDNQAMCKLLACITKKGKCKSHTQSSHEESTSEDSDSKYLY